MKNFFKKIIEAMKAHKGRTIAISVTAFVLICAIVAISCLSAFLFNRFPKGYVPTDAQLAEINNNPENQYKRVVIIGVDGVGDYMSKTFTPGFDKIFSEKTIGETKIGASVTYRGVAVYPTISCENWMSMFHGVRPAYHGFLFRSTNQRVENGEHTNESKYPSFIGQYLAAHPEGKVLSVCTWRGVNNGIIERDERITKYNTTDKEIYQFLHNETVYARVSEKEDELVEAPIIDVDGSLRKYLEAETLVQGFSDETLAMRDAITMQRVIEETTSDPNKYQITYMHLDQVDHAGHSFGYGKPGYVNAVSRVDVLINKLYEAYRANDMLEDTLFIFCTDHGHRLPGGHKNHGKNTSLEVNITFAVAGKTVKTGTPGKYVNTDLAAIVSYALGVKANKNWQGRVPYNMFSLLG